jgi:hypothetical protein
VLATPLLMHLSFFKIALMAIVTMTVFLRTEMHHNSVIDGGIYAGALFFVNLGLMLNGFAELSMTVVRLPFLGIWSSFMDP